jgi:hypothetical protein
VAGTRTLSAPAPPNHPGGPQRRSGWDLEQQKHAQARGQRDRQNCQRERDRDIEHEIAATAAEVPFAPATL